MTGTERVHAVISEAFKDFKYGSFGLLLLTSYTYAQPFLKVCKLEWKYVDLEGGRAVINGHPVYLTPSLQQLLQQQKDLWDFQPYVFPYHRASDNAYRPLTSGLCVKYLGQLSETLGFEINQIDIRKTAIKEMILNGARPEHIQALANIELSTLLKYFEDDIEVLRKIYERPEIYMKVH